MTIELVYYDNTIGDCTTTISVDKNLINKVNKLRVTESQLNKLRIKMDKENSKLTTELNREKNKQQELKRKIKQLQKEVAKSKRLDDELIYWKKCLKLEIELDL